MNCKYEVKKTKINIKDISYLEIFFDNGDCVQIKKNEIVEFSTTFYDKLIVREDKIHATIKDGFVKLKINHTKPGHRSDSCVYDRKNFINNRKQYIENRCVNYGGIDYIKIFDKYNWSRTFFGQIKSCMQNDILILNFIPFTDGKSDSEYHYIMLDDIKKEDINYINLDFENCDGLNIYEREIVEMNLNYSNKLFDSSDSFERQIESGYLIVKLDKDACNRQINTYTFNKNQPEYLSIMKRVCHKEKIIEHDICHLYIHYFDCKYKEECIHINDIRPHTELKELKNLENQGIGYLNFVGGYSKKINNNTFIITFGKNAKETLYKKLLDN